MSVKRYFKLLGIYAKMDLASLMRDRKEGAGTRKGKNPHGELYRIGKRHDKHVLPLSPSYDPARGLSDPVCGECPGDDSHTGTAFLECCNMVSPSYDPAWKQCVTSPHHIQKAHHNISVCQ